mgnify:CR=1 FL=1
MLRIKGLNKSYGTNKVLNDIDFHIDKGEVVAVIGPSGSGKTTLLRCISFLEKADSGVLILDETGEEHDLHSATQAEIRDVRRHMGFVFQSFNLFKNMTALGNCMEGLVTARRVKKDVAEDKARAMLEKVGLADRMNHYPDELSGGQQQRVAIARALSLDPDIILLDEPTSALDPELTVEVLDTIRKLAGEGTTMIVVTHEMSFAREAASRVVFIEDGEIAEEGSAAEFFDHPKEERTREFLNRTRRQP